VTKPSVLVCGIDPGLHGALVVLNRNGLLVSAHATPVIAVEKSNGKGKRHVYLPTQMVTILRAVKETCTDVRICMEQVSAMPGQGVTSMFSMGRGVGTWEGIIAALDLPIFYVTPQTWKKQFRLKGSDKAQSVVRALQLIPQLRQHVTRAKDEGIAEAALIALYLQRLLFSGTARNT